MKDTVKGITAGAADVAKTGLAGRTAYGNGAPISIAVYFDAANGMARNECVKLTGRSLTAPILCWIISTKLV